MGETNENFVIVENGLKGGEEIYLSMPEEPEKFHMEGMELAQIIRQKEAEKARRLKEMNDSLKRISNDSNGNGTRMPGVNGDSASFRSMGQQDRNSVREGQSTGRVMRQRGGGTQ